MYVVKESGQFSCRGFRCLNVGFFLLKIVVFVLYVVKESGQFSCRGFRCLNVGFFLLKIVVFVFLGTVV